MSLKHTYTQREICCLSKVIFVSISLKTKTEAKFCHSCISKDLSSSGESELSKQKKKRGKNTADCGQLLVQYQWALSHERIKGCLVMM